MADAENRTFFLLDPVLVEEQLDVGIIIQNENLTNATHINNYYYYETEQLATLWFLLAGIVLGNLSVLLALSLTKRRKSRVNFFIQHLALADLSVGLVNVLTDLVWKMTLEWNAGNPACKLVRYSQGVVTYSSTYVLVALTIDRYDAIRHPMSFSRGHRKARYLIICAWALSCAFSAPLLVLFEEKKIQDRLQCWIDLPEVWHWQVYMTLVSLTAFFCPAVIIAACYAVIVHTIWSKSSTMVMTPKCNNNWGAVADDDTKRVSSRGIIPKAKVKTVKMTLVIVFVFIACWSPYMLYNLLDVYGVIPRSQTSIAVSTFIQSLAPLNSAVNPIIYWCFSTYLCRDFRNKPQWMDSSRAGRSVRVTDSTSFSESLSSTRRNIHLHSITSAQRKLILRPVIFKMGLNEGLSDRARAFSVANLLGRSPQAQKASDCVFWSKGLGVELCAKELWEEFDRLGTEMLVTKAGRRMFPTLKLRFHGLSSTSTYIVYMDVVSVGNARYRYIHHSSQWTTTGSKEAETGGSRMYIHPDSPAPGHLWTSQGHVSFHEVKLTNNKEPLVRGQISLQSMHKYLPRVHVLEVPEKSQVLPSQLLDYVMENRRRASTFAFPLTTFITVTAYQNQEITRLKIRSNPFAKGYREPSQNGYLGDLQTYIARGMIAPVYTSTLTHQCLYPSYSSILFLYFLENYLQIIRQIEKVKFISRMMGQMVLISYLATIILAFTARATTIEYYSPDGSLQPLEVSTPLIVLFERFILILLEGYRLSPAPDFSNSPPAVGNVQSASRPPAFQLNPTRLPVRQPIRHPPPPPLHLLAATLLPLQEANELAGPPELRPRPPRPPPIPPASISLSPIRPGSEPFLPPPPSKSQMSRSAFKLSEDDGPRSNYQFTLLELLDNL